MAADSPIRRPGEQRRRRDPAAGLRPLRRKPKELSEEPALLDVSNGGGGMVVPGGEPRDRSVPGSSRRGDGAVVMTGEQGTLAAVSDSGVTPDPETLRRAREIASVPYRGGSDDIDMDRTVEQLAEHPVPEDEDIVVRDLPGSTAPPYDRRVMSGAPIPKASGASREIPGRPP